MISSQEFGRFLHRWITERVRLLVLVASSDDVFRAKLTGFVTTFSPAQGLHIGTEDSEVAAGMLLIKSFSDAIIDRADSPDRANETSTFRSGVSIRLPSGVRITLLELME